MAKSPKTTAKLAKQDTANAAAEAEQEFNSTPVTTAATPPVSASEQESNVVGVAFRPSNTFETREQWLEAANVQVVKFFSEQKEPVQVAKDAMISINAPMAKRSKDEDGKILLKGKFAQCFPPDQSTNGRYQIFLSSQLHGDRDLVLALAGQLLRTAVWADNESKDGLSKKAKELISRFGLVYETETGKIACTGDSPLLAFVATLVGNLGPSPYARIDIKAKDVAKPTATRAARVFCADKNCPCKKTDAAANAKKNPDGGFVLNPSDGWILEVLKKANVSISEEQILENKPRDLTGIKCWFADTPSAPDLRFTWSEYKVQKLKDAKEGKTESSMR